MSSNDAVDELTIPSPADFHVHLRQGELMKLVVPHVAEGGIHLAYVMPNLIPPLTIPSQALSYLAELQALAPATQFLSTLYLSNQLTPELIREASRGGIIGVKSYPRGVTTNSEGGVGMEGYAVFDAVFGEMEKCGMVLNLHGEVPSDLDGDGTCVLDAEPRFLPHLLEIHGKFPKLRIVLEHVTTAAAIACVKTLGPNVGATITPHHLALTIDQAVASPLAFCKPIAKYPSDRAALRSVIREGHPRFFLGSDSAPHPSCNKVPTVTIDQFDTLSLPNACAAGIYTSQNLIPLLATIFETSDIPLERMAGFASTFGRAFYGYPAKVGEELTLRRVREGGVVPTAFGYPREEGREYIIPFMAGQKLGWEIVKS